MTIGELRKELEALSELPDSTVVVLAKDAEGNGHSPLEDIVVGMYAAESTWSGEFFMREAERLALQDPDDYDEAPDDAVEAIFLWPVN
jgi:hypothetical protein